jgi:PAS domain S-box-containing protein
LFFLIKFEPSLEKTTGNLTNNTFNKMLIFDENGNILDCNDDFCKSLGYKKDEMLRLNLTDIDSLETTNDIKKKITTIKKQGSITLKTIHRKKNGSSIFVSENIEYLKDKNLFKCNIKEDALLHNK